MMVRFEVTLGKGFGLRGITLGDSKHVYAI
jgi:hypothetical protein